MTFLLGVSITVNIFLIITIFLIFKFRKVVALYDKFKIGKKNINDEVDNYETMFDFFDIDNL